MDTPWYACMDHEILLVIVVFVLLPVNASATGWLLRAVFTEPQDAKQPKGGEAAQYIGIRAACP